MLSRAEAETNLGRMYHDGLSTPPDFTEALKWFGAAAAQGDGGAQYDLGLMSANGEGQPKNEIAAAKWYRAAASPLAAAC